MDRCDWFDQCGGSSCGECEYYSSEEYDECKAKTEYAMDLRMRSEVYGCDNEQLVHSEC